MTPVPRVSPDIVELIKRMAAENRPCGAERIRGALLKLGIRVAKRTVQRYMRDCRNPAPLRTELAYVPAQPYSLGLRLLTGLRRLVPAHLFVLHRRHQQQAHAHRDRAQAPANPAIVVGVPGFIMTTARPLYTNGRRTGVVAKTPRPRQR